MSGPNKNQKHSWLKEASTISEDVAIYYDDWAEKSILFAQKTGVYSQLKQLDLQKQPSPFKQSEFDAVNCVGVLTYIKDPRSLFKEFCRIFRQSGYIVFSHREDLLKAFRYFEILKQLEDKGYWNNLFTSDAKLYLPRNENFTNEVKVAYYIFQTGEDK